MHFRVQTYEQANLFGGKLHDRHSRVGDTEYLCMALELVVLYMGMLVVPTESVGVVLPKH
jgi:hypothetical protein